MKRECGGWNQTRQSFMQTELQTFHIKSSSKTLYWKGKLDDEDRLQVVGCSHWKVTIKQSISILHQHLDGLKRDAMRKFKAPSISIQSVASSMQKYPVSISKTSERWKILINEMLTLLHSCWQRKRSSRKYVVQFWNPFSGENFHVYQQSSFGLWSQPFLVRSQFCVKMNVFQHQSKFIYV